MVITGHWSLQPVGHSAYWLLPSNTYCNFEMFDLQLFQSFEGDFLLLDFDSAGLSLCIVSEMENFTGHSKPMKIPWPHGRKKTLI